jgi:hypothetical protein
VCNTAGSEVTTVRNIFGVICGSFALPVVVRLPFSIMGKINEEGVLKFLLGFMLKLYLST